MKEILSRVRAACDDYNMLPNGSKIAVGISGGKDSLVLLCALARLRGFYPNAFSLIAISCDPCFFGKNADYSQIEALCEQLGVELYIKRTKLYRVVFEERREKNPCSMCARMRRGILCKTAKELGCDSVALGHNADDAAQTVIMNLVQGGRFCGLSAVSYLDRSNIRIIRPLIYCDERLIKNRAAHLGLPILKSGCPVDGKTERAAAQQLIEYLEKDYPDIRAKLIGAAKRLEKESEKGD